MGREEMTEAQRHIENAQSMLDAHSERSFVAETLDGLLVEIERLRGVIDCGGGVLDRINSMQRRMRREMVKTTREPEE